MREIAQNNNGFVWLVINPITNANLANADFDTCRLFCLITHADYEGRIMKKAGGVKQPAKKRDLEEILRITDRTRKSFVKKACASGYLRDLKTGLYLDDYFIRRGSLPANAIKNIEQAGGHIIRMYFQPVRDLYYQSEKYQSPVALRYLIRMIPFVHHRYNFLCYNPWSDDIEESEPMRFADFCATIHYNPTSSGHLFRKLTNSLISVRGSLERAIIRCKGFRYQNPLIFVNPQIFFGSDYRDLYEVTQLFIENGGVLFDPE